MKRDILITGMTNSTSCRLPIKQWEFDIQGEYVRLGDSILPLSMFEAFDMGLGFITLKVFSCRQTINIMFDVTGNDLIKKHMYFDSLLMAGLKFENLQV